MNETVLAILKKAGTRPEFQTIFSTRFLWTDPHISKKMLDCHLDPDHDAASYRHETIKAAVSWMYDSFLAEKNNPAYLDLGCGPGLYTSAMASRGAKVTGVDWSESSIDYGRRHADESGLDVRYVQANYLELSLADKFDLISLISCDICALSLENVLKVFRLVKSVLKPGGVFVFDFHSLHHFSTRTEYSAWHYHETDSFYSTGKHGVFERRFRYDEQNSTLDKYTIVREDSIDELYLWHSFYRVESMTELLGQCGLKVSGVYGSIKGEAYSPDSMNPAISADSES